MKKETKYIFTYNELLEFQYTLATVALLLKDIDTNSEIINKINQNHYKEKFNNAINLLSDYMKSELLHFFSNGNNMYDGVGQTIIYYYMNNHGFNTIEKLYKAIGEATDEEITGVLLSKFYYESTNKLLESNCDIESLVFNYEKVHEIVQSLNFEADSRKKILVDFIENVGEYKQRLALLLKVFNDKVFSNIFSDSFSIIKPYLKLYEDELKADKKAFFYKYMVCDSDIYGDEIYIHISFSRLSGGDFWSSRSNKKEWIILGCYSNEVIGFNNDRDKLFEFLKVIGEKKRIQIIEILRDKPSYVDEIAVKMSMTAPTASYHLTQLQSFDIVDYERYDHRFYYHFNNDMLIMWLDKVKKYFE